MKFRTLLIALLLLGSGCAKKGVVTIGSKNFTEQVVLGEIIAQHVEQRLGKHVDRKLNLGGTLLAHQALQNREIDLYPEYTGTALTSILKQESASDPAIVLERVRSEYRTRSQIEWLDPLGFNNTFVMVIRGPDARTKHLENISDAIKEEWILGDGYEFQDRPDGFRNLMSAYPLRWKAASKALDLGLLYEALAQGQVSMVAANSTDGLLAVRDLKILKDDKHIFPPYQACIAVRSDSLATFPGLRKALEELSGKISDETMRKLNYQVDGKHAPVRDVVAGFLRDAGLR